MSTLFNAQTSKDVEVSLSNNEDINFRSPLHGNATPFLYHCEQNHIEVVIALIQYGCDVTLRYRSNSYNVNGLELVCILGYSQLLLSMLMYDVIVTLINPTDINNGFSYTPLTYSIIYNNTDVFDILLEYGADPILPRSSGVSPLMESCIKNNLHAIDRLLSLNIDVNQRNDFGSAAVFYCRSLDAINRLYVYGADLNIKNNHGDTPLLDSMNSWNPEIINGLLDYGVDVNLVNNEGTSILMKLCQLQNRFKKIDLIEHVLNLGINVNIKDNKGNTALIYAVRAAEEPLAAIRTIIRPHRGIIDQPPTKFKYAKNEYVDVIQKLIKYGADINISNNEGMTALSYAFETKYDNIIQLLLDSGAARMVNFS